MSDQRLERIGTKLYLHATDGTIWRVHDTVFRDSRFVRVELGNARATHRIFVNAEGIRRAHQFDRIASRKVEDAALLAQQLRSAGYLGREAFDPKSVEPER